MSSVLVLKTSGDETMERLFAALGNEHEIDCLLPSDQVDKYCSLYPKIHFIDIQQDGFYELKDGLPVDIEKKQYDRLYVTLTGKTGYHFENVLQFVKKIRSRYACFYNSDGEELVIPPPNFMKDFFWRAYIMIINWKYQQKR